MINKPHARAANLEDVRARWEKKGLPSSLAGKTIMDIGCWAGGFTKVAMEKGARRAIGVDAIRSPELLDGIEFRQLDIMSEAALQLPQVDYVFLLGVLYHTHNPIGMLMRARHLAIEKVFIETAYASDRGGEVFEVFNDDTNWFKPSLPALKWMMKKVGLDVARVVPISDERVALAGTPVEPKAMMPRGRGWMQK